MMDSANEYKEISLDAFREIIAPLGLSMKPQDEVEYFTLHSLVQQSIGAVAQLPEYVDPQLKPDLGPDPVPRTYEEPAAAENPLNAWRHRTYIKSSNSASEGGVLAGKTVAIKDNVCVAGIPMTNGTHPYHLSKDVPYPIPSVDAPLVSRVLEAGGAITGTSTCENYCCTASSFSSATGAVDNPWLPGYTCGGSSSGSATLVAIKLVRKWREARGIDVGDLGEGVDFAVGADQGGSIRLPAAYTGSYGLKPTHGLVPYTAISSLYPMIDYAGPIASSVRDTALFLSVLAGYDGLDPRATPGTPLRGAVPQYHSILDDAITVRKAAGQWTESTAAGGLKVGVLKESFNDPTLDPEVAAVIRRAAERFRSLGATVEEVSVPLHSLGPHIYNAAFRAGMADSPFYGVAPSLLSWPVTEDLPLPGQSWYETMNRSNPIAVSGLLDAHVLNSGTVYPPHRRAKAITHVHELRAAYDAALARYDVLITPANPTVGQPQKSSAKGEMDGVGPLQMYAMGLGNTLNTCPFNASGHPALVIPAGWGSTEDGRGRLPVGMQIVGRRFEESKVFLAAAAWEVGGWGLDSE